MSRDYSTVTIKTLFGQASRCAYPACVEPLIFTDRGAKTVVAQIAHIRSEKPNGPRHDPTYHGDVDGPENLLLLCGKHHRPVDMHESIYSIQELEGWKAAQVAGAGAGTVITTAEARLFTRLSDEERHAISQVARLAERVVAAADAAREELNRLEADYRRAVHDMRSKLGPMWEVDEQGERLGRIDDRVELSVVEQRKWHDAAEAIAASHKPVIDAAVSSLREEVAVLRMFSGGALAEAAAGVIAVAQGTPAHIGNEAVLETSHAALAASVANLWQTANGEQPDAS